MSNDSEFKGFSRESFQFYRDIKHNNNKVWFEAHKPDFERNILDPAKDFVVAMGESLKTVAPRIHADPRVNKSFFRI